MNYGGGDHKRQTRAAYGRSSWRRLSLRPICYSSATSVTYSAAVAVAAFAVCGAICVMPLVLFV